MSSDLLAELDSFYRDPQNGVSSTVNAPAVPSTSAFDDLSFLGPSNANKLPFSLREQQQKQQQRFSVPVSRPSNNTWGDHWELQTVSPKQPAAPDGGVPWGNFGAMAGTAMENSVTSGTIKGFSSNTANSTSPMDLRTGPFSTLSQPPKSIVRSPVNRLTPEVGSNILFDATSCKDSNGHNVEEDEFGDFETAMPSSPNQDFLQMSPPLIALGKSSELPLTSPTAFKSPSTNEENRLTGLELSIKAPTSMTGKSMCIPSVDPGVFGHSANDLQIPASMGHDDEEWGDFADLPTPTSKPKQAYAGTVDALDSPIAVRDPAPPPALPSVSAAPPTNIPPPSMLLSIFPQIFNLPQSTLFQSVANQPFSVRNRILSDPSTITFLHSYICIAIVAARIIAGRKLRWKRDVHLSQAMRIGPAAAAGSKGGGMKLAPVDKTEATREDREAAEVVRVWHDQVGRLRSAVATANSSVRGKAAHLVVPEIIEAIQVKSERGALTAPKPCALCGLKRDERLVKIDGQVEDSFGEWWIEHWGHRTCRNFWVEHEGKFIHR